MTSRSYCFTINNPTDEDIKAITECNCRYIVFGREIGTTNNVPHIQGYIELDKPIRMKACGKLLGGRAHLEKRRGTREQARDYCTKDGNYEIRGDWAAGGQGKRTDIAGIMNQIKEGKKKLEMMEENPEVYSKHMRFINEYVAELEKESTREFRQLETHVLVGKAGSGKTKMAYESDPDIFVVDTTETFPFDGYNGEKTILLDDFYGGMPYSRLLRVLDGYQYRVNVKGGHRYAQWNKIFITSNEEPTQWYKIGLTEALKRRITSVTKFGNEVEGNSIPPLLQEKIELEDNILDI